MLKSGYRLLKVLLAHKYFVFRAGLVCRVPWLRLLLHDWTKLTSVEFWPYARRFYSDNGSDDSVKEWWYAFLHHVHNNKHHWEHWCRLQPDGSVIPMEIPETYAREMVADWWGAGRAYGSGWRLPIWYRDNKHRIILHESTRKLVEELIEDTALKLVGGDRVKKFTTNYLTYNGRKHMGTVLAYSWDQAQRLADKRGRGELVDGALMLPAGVKLDDLKQLNAMELLWEELGGEMDEVTENGE